VDAFFIFSRCTGIYCCMKLHSSVVFCNNLACVAIAKLYVGS